MTKFTDRFGATIVLNEKHIEAFSFEGFYNGNPLVEIRMTNGAKYVVRGYIDDLCLTVDGGRKTAQSGGTETMP